MNRTIRISLILFFLLLSNNLSADGIIIEKIKHPYVQTGETEIELNLISQDDQQDQPDNLQSYQLSIGKSWQDKISGEINFIGEKFKGGGFNFEEVEIEVNYQMTEQGEYWADYGVQFELEKSFGDHIWEVGSLFIAEKEFGKFSHTVNVGVSFESGDDIDNELESKFIWQTRYRYRPFFEPALEYFLGEDTQALGPAFQSTFALGQARKLHVETAVLFGLDNKSADQTIRFLIEFEF